MAHHHFILAVLSPKSTTCALLLLTNVQVNHIAFILFTKCLEGIFVAGPFLTNPCI